MPQDLDERTEPRPRREPARAARPGALDAAARARIGRALRLQYADVLDQPIPERLRTLVDALAARSDREVPR